MSTPVKWNGQSYPSISAAANALKISISAMSARVKKGQICDADLSPRGGQIGNQGGAKEITRGNKVSVRFSDAELAAIRKLQLGHPANGVERPVARRANQAALRSFNWATPRTGWKAQYSGPSGVDCQMLQLGHPANGVERRVGPPRCGPVQGLQLGHPANGVERRENDQAPPRRDRFNWATPRTGWKAAFTVRESRYAWSGFNWATPRTGWKAFCVGRHQTHSA